MFCFTATVSFRVNWIKGVCVYVTKQNKTIQKNNLRFYHNPYLLAGRYNSAVIDTNLNTSTLQSAMQFEAASGYSTNEHILGHRRQKSAGVSVTVYITSCVGIAYCRGI
jgi:hypothetical protein